MKREEELFYKTTIVKKAEFRLFLIGDGSDKYKSNVDLYNEFLKDIDSGKKEVISSTTQWGSDNCYRIQVHYYTIIKTTEKRSDVDISIGINESIKPSAVTTDNSAKKEDADNKIKTEKSFVPLENTLDNLVDKKEDLEKKH